MGSATRLISSLAACALLAGSVTVTTGANAAQDPTERAESAQRDVDSLTGRLTRAQEAAGTARQRLAAARGEVSAASRVLRRSRELTADAKAAVAVAESNAERAEGETQLAASRARDALARSEEAAKQAAAARAALQRLVRDAYINGATPSDLALLAGLTADGPDSLADISRQVIAVDRLEDRSVSDADSAATTAAAAAEAADTAGEEHGSVLAAEQAAQGALAEARVELVTAVAARRSAAEAYRSSRSAAASAAQDLKTAQRTAAGIARTLRDARQEARVAARRACALTPLPVVPPAPAGNSARLVWGVLMAEGFTEQAAAAILGNLQQESNIDPTTVQNGGPGMGLAQWSRGGRWDTGPDSLLEFARAHAMDPWDATTQTRFMLTEMAAGWGGFDLASFRQMTDIVAATVYFHDVFERSADSPEQVLAVRGTYAIQWFVTLTGTKPPKPSEHQPKRTTVIYCPPR